MATTFIPSMLSRQLLINTLVSFEIFLNEVYHTSSVAQAHVNIVYWDCTYMFLHIWGMDEWINCHKVVNFMSAFTTVKITVFTCVCAILKLWHTSFRKKLDCCIPNSFAQGCDLNSVLIRDLSFNFISIRNNSFNQYSF